MGASPSKSSAGRPRPPSQEEELAKHGVLVPPSFGTGMDFVPPPSSSYAAQAGGGAGGGDGLGGASDPPDNTVRSSIPHLLLSSRTRGGGGLVASLARRDDPASRLLGMEHLRPGAWVSASTPDSGGNVCAGGHAGNNGGWRGFLSGASLAPLGSRRDANAVGGAGVTLSTSSDGSGAAGGVGSVSGGGGGLYGGGDPSSSSSSMNFGGQASAFASRSIGGGVLSAFVSASDSDGDGNSGPPTSDDPAAYSSGVSSAAAASMASVRNLVSRGIKSSEDSDMLSRPPPPSTGFNGRIGWNYARALDLSPKDDSAESKKESGTRYYRNDPFKTRKKRKDEAPSAQKVAVNVGYAALFTKPRPGVPPDSRGPLTLGRYDASAVSSHLFVDSPSHGATAAVEGTLPVAALAGITDGGASFSSPEGMLHAARGIGTRGSMSYYASFDLNRAGGLPDDNGDKGGGDEHMNAGPPIVVSLHKIDAGSSAGRGGGGGLTESAATISQTITFDRLVANVLEERCPRIRNTVSWAVRMSRTTATSPAPSVQSGGDTSRTDLSAAAAWQINRGLGCKVRLDARGGWTFGLLLKRWAQPRVTASLLFGSSSSDHSRSGATGRGAEFKGVGVQIETGPLPGGRGGGVGALDGAGAAARVGADGRVGFDAADFVYGAAGAGGNRAGDNGPPATRAQLVD